MRKYTASRELALLSVHELIEVVQEELMERIQKNKEELILLEQIVPIFKNDIEEVENE